MSPNWVWCCSCSLSGWKCSLRASTNQIAFRLAALAFSALRRGGCGDGGDATKVEDGKVYLDADELAHRALTETRPLAGPALRAAVA